MMYEATSFECSRVAQDLQIRKVQVESVLELFNEGNTVPFITRYRKERTGGLDEDAIRAIQTRLNFIKQLNDRKATILRSIETQGKLTEELRREIVNAPTVRRLEDLYLPFKPKKKSLANAAREKGLEPLALAIWHSDQAANALDELLPALVNPEKQLNTVEDVKTGVQHLLAEYINETAEVRATLRRVLWRMAGLASVRNEKAPEGLGSEFKPYFEFKEALQDIRPHRILALNRGEKEGFLKVKLDWPAEHIHGATLEALADHLYKIAGKTPAVAAARVEPAPSPSASDAPPSESGATEATGESAEQAPPPPAIVESEAASEPSSAPSEDGAAPLVESLSTEPKPTMTGELLAEHMEFRSPHVGLIMTCMEDALSRLLLPSLEREIRTELTDEAELHAIKVFAHNIRSLLMQPPLVGKRVLAVDPGFRTGCKLAALDEFGNLLDHTIIYPHGGGGGGGKKHREKDKKPGEATAPAAPPAPTDAAAPTSAPPAPEATASPAAEPAPAVEHAAAPTETPAVEPTAPPAETPAASSDPAPVDTPAPPAETPAASSEPAAAATPVAPAEPAPPPVDKRAEAKAKLEEFARKHNLTVIAIGNGTACRETEEMIADVIATSMPELSYVIVSEAGASVYSVSPLAKEEFGALDPVVRSGASIGRRLQDPLSELVKIDPQSLGVGLYQHDMGRKELKEALEGVVESCVNLVGVDVNTASVPLLRYVSGLNQLVAREIVEHRKKQPFTNRQELLGVTGMGPARFTQAAGFLKIPTATNPLDRTWIHPESYPVTDKILAELGTTSAVLDDPAAHEEFRAKLNSVNLEELARKVEIKPELLDDIFMALAKPGRDPREELPPPIFKKGVLKLEDLQPGLELKGTVLNVVDFGAFVDVGLKESGLVHISQMANKYIKSPYDVVSVNDIVVVWVLKIDKDSSHVSLTMIQPGTERRPEERRPPPRREADAGRPQRGRGAPSQGGGQQREARPADRGQQGGQQGGRGGGRPPQRGGGRPPQRGGPPRESAPQPSAPPAPPPPPPKPRREPPKPKLTQAAIEGKAPLRTLGELAAFFAAKEEKEKKPAEAPPPAPPAAEEKKEDPPAENAG